MGFQTPVTNVRATLRGITSQGPAVLLMACRPLLPVHLHQGLSFSSSFRNCQPGFFAPLWFHSDLHLRARALRSPSLAPTPRPHAPYFPPCSAFPPAGFSTLGHLVTIWSQQLGYGHRKTCPYCQGCIGSYVLLSTKDGDIFPNSYLHEWESDSGSIRTLQHK